MDTFIITVTPQSIGQTKKIIIDTHKKDHEERGSKCVKHTQAAEIVKGGPRKKFRQGKKIGSRGPP